MHCIALAWSSSWAKILFPFIDSSLTFLVQYIIGAPCSCFSFSKTILTFSLARFSKQSWLRFLSVSKKHRLVGIGRANSYTTSLWEKISISKGLLLLQHVNVWKYQKTAIPSRILFFPTNVPGKYEWYGLHLAIPWNASYSAHMLYDTNNINYFW